MVNNSTNINKRTITYNLKQWNTKRPGNMTLEIQILIFDRQIKKLEDIKRGNQKP